MDCLIQHSIELKQKFCGNVVYNREIVRLTGKINQCCDCKSIEILTNDTKCHVPIIRRDFKHLIRLQTDCDNEIELRYCNAKLSLTFVHKSIDGFYSVQPLYIINESHDGSFQSTENDVNNGVDDALRKIDLALELVQCIISSKFNESDFGERTFSLRKSRVFQSELDVFKARSMNQWELYDAMASEILVKEGGVDVTSRRKFVGFMSCTQFKGLSRDDEYSYANIKAKTFANPALGGGFFCLMGSGCFYSWPNLIDDVINAFTDKKQVDLSQVLDDSNYRKTYGGCFATSVGSLVHEVGHIFDLAHSKTGMMGNDIDYVHRFFLTENRTEILPSRAVQKCQLEKQIDKAPCLQRFTKIRKPGGRFLEKYHEQKNSDLTFFEHNCMITLWNHRWFSQQESDDPIIYNDDTRLVRSSKHPIKLVEIREPEDSLTVKFWPLENEEVYEFEIPPEVDLKEVSLFAITSNGDILKRNFQQ